MAMMYHFVFKGINDARNFLIASTAKRPKRASLCFGERKKYGKAERNLRSQHRNGNKHWHIFMRENEQIIKCGKNVDEVDKYKVLLTFEEAFQTENSVGKIFQRR